MINTAFSPWPQYSEKEAELIRNVILSNKVNYWTGEECRKFEYEFARWIETKYAIALANGTIALDVALKAINLSSKDEVIVTSRTFLASASSIVINGAIPVFADVDRDSQNITENTIKQVITSRTKAIICVHLAGWPCEMDPIIKLAKEYNLYVIEDCAQAHGARYKGRPVGSIGHIGAWSFCQDKIMTTGGEGGMVTTNDQVLWSKMWSYKDHGKSWDAIYNSSPSSGFRWVHDSFGINGRMIEIQAAIGRYQLQQMPYWHGSRLVNAQRIWETAAKIDGLRVPSIPSHVLHAVYKCYVFVEPEKLNSEWNRNRIIQEINYRGVPCFSGSCSEVYLEKAFDNTPWRPKERLPIAAALGETSLMFLVHPTLKESEIEKTCIVLKEVMKLATLTITNRELVF